MITGISHAYLYIFFLRKSKVLGKLPDHGQRKNRPLIQNTKCAPTLLSVLSLNQIDPIMACHDMLN